jgi:translocation and assembly module TamB
VALAFVAVLAAVVRYGPATATGRRVIENALSGQSVGRLGRLRIEGLRGDVWGDFSIARLTIADKAGVWVDARNLSLNWDAAALLTRRLHVRALAVRLVTLDHRPTLTPAAKPSPSPLAIDLDAASARLEMLAGFAQVRGVYDLRARLRLERNGAAKGSIDAASALHRGDFLRTVFDVGGKGAFNVAADALETNGGALAGAAGLAPDQPFSLTARAVGGAKAGAFTISTRVGQVTPVEATGTWNGAGGSASGQVVLTSSRLLDRYAAMAGAVARFEVDGRAAADGSYALALAARSDNITISAKGEADIARRAIGPQGVAVDLQVGDPGRTSGEP